jgi:hypothetical protein
MRTLGLLLSLSVVSGCGAPQGKVSGRVLYQGSPLSGGLVTFQPANPKYNAVVVPVDEQGNYEATLPVGAVQVTVDNRSLQPRSLGLKGVSATLPPEVKKAMSQAQPKPPPPAAADSAPPKPRGKYVAIPSKYYTIEESGLQFTVERGSQKHDIELK